MAKNKDSDEPGKIIRISPETSKFAKTEVHDSVARLTVFHWIAALYLVQVGAYVTLTLTAHSAEAEKIYDLLKTHTIILGPAVGFYLSERRGRSR